MKKKRSDSIIDGLPQNQRDQIEGWLCEDNLSYADAQARALADLDVRLPLSGLVSFFQECQQRRMLDRIAASRKNANEVVAQFKENPADIYNALIGIVGQVAFESGMKGEKMDAELVFNMTKLVMNARKQTMEQQALDLEEKKFQRLTCELFLKWYGDKKVKDIIAGDDSNDSKTEQLGQRLFGEDWK